MLEIRAHIAPNSSPTASALLLCNIYPNFQGYRFKSLFISINHTKSNS